jgi:hypothetical protein
MRISIEEFQNNAQDLPDAIKDDESIPKYTAG